MTRVKDADEVRAKMQERAGTAGKYLVSSLNKAESPIDVLLKDPKGNIDKMVKGVQEAQRTGSIEAGLKKAQAAGSWEKAIPRAGAHFEERSTDMVNNAMTDYDKRKVAIENAQKVIADMPSTTRDQRIARSTAYQKAVAVEMDKVYGRKA